MESYQLNIRNQRLNFVVVKGNDLNFMIKKDDKEYINTWKKIGQDPSILIHFLDKN